MFCLIVKVLNLEKQELILDNLEQGLPKDDEKLSIINCIHKSVIMQHHELGYFKW